MFLLDSDSQLDCVSNLLEAGNAVNSTEDISGQSPAHLAAYGGQAFCLLGLLRTGADVNQQDYYGETAIHKAAKAGSVECISVLVASEAELDICNNDGKTAEDLAWSCGFADCARLLGAVRASRRLKASGLAQQVPVEQDIQSGTLAGKKRAGEISRGRDGKRSRDW